MNPAFKNKYPESLKTWSSRWVLKDKGASQMQSIWSSCCAPGNLVIKVGSERQGCQPDAKHLIKLLCTRCKPRSMRTVLSLTHQVLHYRAKTALQSLNLKFELVYQRLPSNAHVSKKLRRNLHNNDLKITRQSVQSQNYESCT